MRFISTEDAPRPGGHYSQAVVHQGVVYVAGQLPIVPETGEKCLGTVEEQTERTLLNLEAVLKAAGSGRDRVLRVTVYVSDISLWGRINAVYAGFFGDHRPARTVVPTRDLHYGFLVEIDAVAATDAGRTEEQQP
ncbi:2-iminobutanoate/2-iminopropanoate deaminase [Aminivibrio pyruvatiphilus]|uniref:2-iminobutanoate/2-iminopropanoate deaminase n=1 Tax=Aminivibrio pyruvatiphilus TaxID=1005740 RepID=A0A4R8M478_9BACT|nr:Rid family detoxifying hydrolase [Aminivibrio pyruvatiphilus]TDY59528.1 2-iminobutanoate/2-iminopropanoate deaminase [Aminivibrio pyruvatiphilus]